MKKYIYYLPCFILCCFAIPAHASHFAGGSMSYEFLGATPQGNHYRVTLVLFADCYNGEPTAIMADNPAMLAVYDGNGSLKEKDGDINCFRSETVPPFFDNPCGIIAPKNFCLLKKTFFKEYYLPVNASSYTVSYQKCCRNDKMINIANGRDFGITLHCVIPASQTNSSAVFSRYPSAVVCLNKPFQFDHSATDADGDSLSYSFGAALVGGSPDNVNVDPPLAGPYDSLAYAAPGYTARKPMEDIKIDAATGIISGTASQKGTYLVTVYCYEWRNGAVINTTTREFEFMVKECVTTYQPYAGRDTTLYAADTLQFNPSGATSYTWLNHSGFMDTTAIDAVVYFPSVGDYSYILQGTNDAGCVGTDTVHVSVLDHSWFSLPNAFSPDGNNQNDVFRPIPVADVVLNSFKIFNRKGNMVYSSNNVNSGWDGIYKGIKQDLGTYYWELEYHDNKGIGRALKGDVTLVR
ncbi:MAG: domain containing protein [Flavipsychrobacter sp.]|nr:domain containing protein [Flavipsychrobacter sp.]